MHSISTQKIYLSSWDINAGITGFLNILDKKPNNPRPSLQYLEINENDLDNFTEKYFDYLTRTYEKFTSWYKITSYLNIIEGFENNEYSNFDENDLKKLNNYINDVAKKFLKSNSYIAAFKLTGSEDYFSQKEKQLSTIKLNKNSSLNEAFQDIKVQHLLIKKLIEDFKIQPLKKYLLGKNIMYQFIKHSWNGISFLNPQCKDPDFYNEYNNYFVIPAQNYLASDKSKYKYTCSVCDSKIKDLKNDLSFLNQTGFDVNRKSSHAWNFTNDIAICDVCKLLYSCMPAGISFAYDQGLFVNANSSLNILQSVNSNIKNQIYHTDISDKKSLTYRALLNALHIQHNQKLSYELSDVQIVRYEKDNYKFNLLSKKLIRIIYDSKNLIDSLINSGYTENKEYMNIYEETINRLFNNQNLYLQIHKLLHYKLSSSSSTYYNMTHIMKIIQINFNYMKGVGYMENIHSESIEKARKYGYHLKESYKGMKATDKLGGISYRLLNTLKTSNPNAFMDILLNCYLYSKSSVPKLFIECLKDEDAFKTIGYSFVAGLNSPDIDNKTKIGGTDND